MKQRKILGLLLVLVIGASAFLLLCRDERGELDTQGNAKEPAADTSEPSVPSTLESPREEIANSRTTTAASSGDPGEASRRSVEGSSKRLTLRVLEPDGKPVRGAEVAVFRGESVLGSDRTDAQGRVQLDGNEGSADYALLAPGWNFVRGLLETCMGERELVLHDAFTLAGRVLLDGVPPPPMELHLDRGIPPLPTEVFRALGGARNGRIFVSARTRADGSFAFRGLQDVEPFEVGWDEPYFLRKKDGDKPVRFALAAASQPELVLALTEGVELRLRVVDQQGEPVASAPIALRGAGPFDNLFPFNNRAADERGRYSQAILPDLSRPLRIEVALSEGFGLRLHELAWPPNPRGILDVGELATGIPRNVVIRVRDLSGKPIEGASIVEWPSLRGSNEITDGEGNATRSVEAVECELLVSPPEPLAASEYLGAIVRVPLGALEVNVVMEAATRLEFELVDAGDADCWVSLSAALPLYVSEQRGVLSREELPGRGAWNQLDLAPYSLRFSEGRCTFHGLAPDQALRAVLRSRGGVELASTDVAPLHAGEHRIVPLRIANEPKSLRVRVLGPDREPVSAASVSVAEVNAQEGWSLRGQDVDARGEVELTGLRGDHCTLFVSAAGLVSNLRTVLIQNETVEIQLEKPRSVEIELVTPEGQLLADDALLMPRAIVSELLSQRGIRVGPARYRFDDLPSGMILLTISKLESDDLVTQLHDTRVPFSRVVVGELGVIEARAGRPPGYDPRQWAIGLALPGASGDWTRRELVFSGRGGAHVPLPGLALRTWQVWLERRSEQDPNVWTRIGEPTTVRLDAVEPRAFPILRAD